MGDFFEIFGVFGITAENDYGQVFSLNGLDFHQAFGIFQISQGFLQRLFFISGAAGNGQKEKDNQNNSQSGRDSVDHLVGFLRIDLPDFSF